MEGNLPPSRSSSEGRVNSHGHSEARERRYARRQTIASSSFSSPSASNMTASPQARTCRSTSLDRSRESSPAAAAAANFSLAPTSLTNTLSHYTSLNPLNQCISSHLGPVFQRCTLHEKLQARMPTASPANSCAASSLGSHPSDTAKLYQEHYKPILGSAATQHSDATATSPLSSLPAPTTTPSSQATAEPKYRYNPLRQQAACMNSLLPSGRSYTPPMVHVPSCEAQKVQHFKQKYCVSPAITPTTDLIKTAVSVREVSKRISKTTVKIDNPSVVMIICKQEKAVMNRALELAEWLVNTSFITPECTNEPNSLSSLVSSSGTSSNNNSDDSYYYDYRKGLVVYIEKQVIKERRHLYKQICDRNPQDAIKRIKTWTPEQIRTIDKRKDGADGHSPGAGNLFDFVISLGGDGTVLYTSWLFQKTVPAIIPFHFGSLGFLTVFNYRRAKEVLTNSLTRGVKINLRMRFTCTVYRLIDRQDHDGYKGEAESQDQRQTPTPSGQPPKVRYKYESPQDLLSRTLSETSIFNGQFKPSVTAGPSAARIANSDITNNSNNNNNNNNDSMADDDTPVQHIPTCYESEWEDMPPEFRNEVHKVWRKGETFQVLNEVVVDRGQCPYMAMLELYGDGDLLTTVQADGLVLSTPTGSTAYSLAAGGSLVHPEIPAMLVTPICAHTLSFRPMLLPDSMVIRVVVPPDSRGTAWASFDGRNRIELQRGDHIQITASQFPLPTVCANQSQSKDWFLSLRRCLSWNERKRQKRFDPLESSQFRSSSSADRGNDVVDEDDNNDSDSHSNSVGVGATSNKAQHHSNLDGSSDIDDDDDEEEEEAMHNTMVNSMINAKLTLSSSSSRLSVEPDEHANTNSSDSNNDSEHESA